MPLKKILLVCSFTAMLVVGTAPLQTTSANPIIAEIIRQAVVKVIKAMDLMVQRLQNQTIRLQHIQKAIENTMSKLKLQEISEWGEKQRTLFDTYYKELWKVKSVIAYYKSIKDITKMQVDLVKEYKSAYALIQKDKHFSPKEILYIYDVYTGILEESLKNVEQLMLVINSFSTQMADAKRLELIAVAAEKVSSNLSHLRRFTQQNMLLSVERARDEQEQRSIKSYYGIE